MQNKVTYLSGHPMDKPSVTNVGRHSEHFHAPLTTLIDHPGWHVLMTRTNVPLQDSAPQCQVEFGLGKTNAHTFDVIPFRVPRMTLI